MIDAAALRRALSGTPIAPFADALIALSASAAANSVHGDMPRWQAALDALPAIAPIRTMLDADCVGVENDGLDESVRVAIKTALLELHPWRKGPFCIHGIHVDSEWRSNLKWQRVAPHLSPLTGRTVLDVGCGNGYYGWRMLGAGARVVVGIDPTDLYVMQHRAMSHFIGPRPNHVLPLGIDDLPDEITGFDTVFSMGVLYHRRDPLAHLRRLRTLLRSGGEVVVEGLAIEGDAGDVLIPDGRYAKMRNVWSIPSVATLIAWLGEAAFENARCVDLTPTTSGEQRSTAWMRYESLPDFLNPKDTAQTAEGYPAPIRAVVVATAPG